MREQPSWPLGKNKLNLKRIYFKRNWGFQLLSVFSPLPRVYSLCLCWPGCSEYQGHSLCTCRMSLSGSAPHLAQLSLQKTILPMLSPPSPALKLPCSEERTGGRSLPDHCCSISRCGCQPGPCTLLPPVLGVASKEKTGWQKQTSKCCVRIHPVAILQ